MFDKPEVSETSFEVFRRECLLQNLDAQPKVAQAIRMMWGSLELAERFDGWIVGEEGARLGLKSEQAKSILELSLMHDRELKLAGLTAPENPQQWNAPKWKLPKNF